MSDARTVLAEWQQRTDAATEGPWEHGDRQHVAGVLPEQFGDGKCAYCDRYGEPTWVGKQLINGKRMLAHAHESAEPWWDHGIYALRGAGSVLVVNDIDEYGYIADPDAEFIAASRTAMPCLLSAVENVLALHRPVHPVFNWQTGLHFEEPCPTCHGKAGVHECGCWGDTDIQFECFECIRPTDEKSRRYVPYPCPTVQAINDALLASEPSGSER